MQKFRKLLNRLFIGNHSVANISNFLVAQNILVLFLEQYC